MCWNHNSYDAHQHGQVRTHHNMSSQDLYFDKFQVANASTFCGALCVSYQSDVYLSHPHFLTSSQVSSVLTNTALTGKRSEVISQDRMNGWRKINKAIHSSPQEERWALKPVFMVAKRCNNIVT